MTTFQTFLTTNASVFVASLSPYSLARQLHKLLGSIAAQTSWTGTAINCLT